MSAHFDGGAEIAGRRLREVEVSYVDDPTLDLEGQDSDSCPPSPPPTYYLRVREDSQKCAVDISNGARQEEKSVKKECEEAVGSSAASWNWRYVNVEKKALLVWNRRGGKLLRSIPLADVDSLRVVSDQVKQNCCFELPCCSASCALIQGGSSRCNVGLETDRDFRA